MLILLFKGHTVFLMRYYRFTSVEILGLNLKLHCLFAMIKLLAFLL